MSNYFIDILEITLPVSALILILAAFSPLIKRGLVTKWRYYMWLFIAIRIALPFKPIADKPAISVPNIIYRGQAVVDTVADRGIDLQTLLAVIYFSGAALFLLFQLVCYIDFLLRVRRWQSPADKCVIKKLEAAKAELDIKRSLRAVYCKIADTPMILGILRPKLILPRREFTDNELSIILKHELIHLRNHDILYKLIITLATALHWFNPAVYLMSYMANRDIELVCDSDVIQGTSIEFRKGYCKTILSVAHKRRGLMPPLSTGFAISKQIIRERIEDILSFKIKKRGIVLFTVTAVSVIAAGSVIGFATETIRQEVEQNHPLLTRATPAPRQSEPPTDAPTSAGIYTSPQITAAPRPAYADISYAAPAATAAPAQTAAPNIEAGAAASWWSDGMTQSRQELDNGRISGSNVIRNVNGGATASLNKTFTENDTDVTLGTTYYVEPNKSMKIYHKGGVVQAADATTGEVVYDSTGDIGAEGVIQAGENGAYYRLNISQSEENEENAQIYIIEQ